jgi:hypothetical protein
VRGLRGLHRLILLGNFSAKQGLRRLLLTYRKLQRRHHSSLAVLEPVNYFPYTPSPADVRFAAVFLARSLQRRRRRARVYTRAKRLRFVRGGEGSMLFARLQPYYHSRVLGTKHDRLGSGKSLRALDAAIALQQEVFADRQQLIKITAKTSVSRQSLRVPGVKEKRLRALFHLYTGARLFRIGFKRSSQLDRERRTLAVYARRHAPALHKARSFVFRQTRYQQQCRQLARRGSPAGVLKLVTTMKLRRKACLQLTRR